MQSNNGLYKVNIFDPDTETWVQRREPCTRVELEQRSVRPGAVRHDPNAQFYPGCDPRRSAEHTAVGASDQKYARWYPSAVPLPNDMVLVIGGFDQDNTVPPDPDRVAKGNEPEPDRHGLHRQPRQHRRARGLRPEDRSEHRARERAHGVSALSADGGRPDRAGKG